MKKKFIHYKQCERKLVFVSWQKFDFSFIIVQFELVTDLHVFDAHATLANTMYMYNI